MDRRDDPEFQRWAKEVKIRDNWTCQICEKQGVYLEAHHKWAWNAYPDLRFDLSCGVTLCKNCHDRFHQIYNFGDNTEFQYRQFEEIMAILKKLARSETPPTFL